MKKFMQGSCLALSGLAWIMLAGSSFAQAQRTPAHIVPPDYPRGAERREIEGRVVITYSVTAEGETANLEVTESEPSGIFDRAALRAVEQWRFEPADAQSDGHVQELNFQLGG